MTKMFSLKDSLIPMGAFLFLIGLRGYLVANGIIDTAMTMVLTMFGLWLFIKGVEI